MRAPEELFELGSSLDFKSDIWALGITIAKVRCGFTPFADEYDDFLGALKKMEAIMGSMPESYRTVWKSWNGLYINNQDDNGKCLDEDSWRDEAVFATLHAQEQEYIRGPRIGEGCSPNYLHYRMQGGLTMNVDKEMAADLAAQAASNPPRLPTHPWGADARDIEWEALLDKPMEESEIRQMFDLFLMMFKWHQEQRATLSQIASHEWFGDRNHRLLAASSSASGPSNNKRAHSPSPSRPGKKSRCSEGVDEEQLDGSKGFTTDVWRPWSLYWGRIVMGLRNGVGWMMKALT